MTGDAPRLGLYGFGASARTSSARSPCTRGGACSPSRAPGDEASQAFALELGCEWAGDAMGPAPEELDAAIIFAPVGELVPAALRAVGRGGVVVCAGIHMSDIPSFAYELLWGERVLRSVANLTRADALEFLDLAPARARAHARDDLRAPGRGGRARRRAHRRDRGGGGAHPLACVA